MIIRISPLLTSSTFAAEISGIDLKQPLPAAVVQRIEATMDAYAVVVLRGQDIGDAEQRRFAEYFGAIENAKGTVRANDRVTHGIADISNLDESDRPLPADDRRRIFNMGNMLWHSDSSFSAQPARYSILSARAIPTRGGDTEFADMRAAYDGLDAETRALVDPLHAEHSLLHSRGKLGFTAFTPEEIERFAPVPQALVSVHPATRRKSLFLSAHIGRIVELPLCDGLVLLADLTEHATQKEYRYRHSWRQFDLIMWDNRVTMHRGHRYDEREKRDLRRFTTVA